MSDEIAGSVDARVHEADSTGRRKLLKQMAAGGGAAALVWAAPTLTRTDRASAAASDGGGGGLGTQVYFEDFSGYSASPATGTDFGFRIHEAGPLIGTSSSPLATWNVDAGSIDLIRIPYEYTGMLAATPLPGAPPAVTADTIPPVPRCVELASGTNTILDVITLTYDVVSAGSYRFRFKWIDRTRLDTGTPTNPTSPVRSTNPSYNWTLLDPTYKDESPPLILPRPFTVDMQAGTATVSGGTGLASVMMPTPPVVTADVGTVPAQTYSRDFVVDAPGTIEISLSDSWPLSNGFTFTDFEILQVS